MVKIYGLVCPITNEIRYIGKTERTLEKRLQAHIAEAKKIGVTHKQRWIRQCLASGVAPAMWLLEEVPLDRWADRERSWIERAQRLGLNLTNQTPGGEGVQLTDPETIARHRASLSEAMHKVRQRPGFSETRSAIAKGNWQNHRHKMMEAFARPETKANQSESKKKAWADPAKRENLMNRWTPEAKAKQAAEILSRKEKIQAAMTPEVRARQAAKLRETWAKRKAAKA